MNRIHGDPRHFALEAYHGSTGRANALSKAASSANVLAFPPPPPPPDEATRCQSESQSNVSRDSTGRNGSLLAGAAPGAVFSADDFNTVAGLLDAGLPHALRHEVTYRHSRLVVNFSNIFVWFSFAFFRSTSKRFENLRCLTLLI